MDTQTRILLVGYLPQVVFDFLVVWYFDLTLTILKTTYAGMILISDMFALPVLFKTFFVPWRSEERKGFVAVALAIAIIMRIIAIFTAVLIIVIAGLVGIAAVFIWLMIPIILIALFFIGISKILLI